MASAWTNCPVCEAPLGRCVRRFADRGVYHYIRECSRSHCRHLCLGFRPAGAEPAAAGTPPLPDPAAEAVEPKPGVVDGAAVVELIDRWLGRGGALLTLGLSDEGTAAALRRAGHRVVAVEPGAEPEAATPVARAPDPLPDGESYAAAVLWDVLQGVVDPRGLLADLRRYLADGARLFIRVSSYEHLDAYVQKMRESELLAARNRHYFTRFTLGQLVLQAGFFVEDLASDADQGHLTLVAAVNHSLAARLSPCDLAKYGLLPESGPASLPASIPVPSL